MADYILERKAFLDKAWIEQTAIHEIELFIEDAPYDTLYVFRERRCRKCRMRKYLMRSFWDGLQKRMVSRLICIFLFMKIWFSTQCYNIPDRLLVL